MSPGLSSSYVTKVCFAACAIVASSRRRPTHTFPASSAQRAWNSAMSGEIAGTSRIGSFPGENGFSDSLQSVRMRMRSEPSTPRKGMNGTPFSLACSALCTAGQVASRTTISPFSTASVKRGARPASPSDTALDSTSATQPAPISRSAHMPSTGTPRSRRYFFFWKMSARTPAIAGREQSGGNASRAPSRLSAARSAGSAANREPLDLECRLADADRHALAFLAAGADTRIEREVVADHGDARQHVGAVADQGGALHRMRDLAVLDQVGLRGREHELAAGDVDLAAAEVGGVDALQ